MAFDTDKIIDTVKKQAITEATKKVNLIMARAFSLFNYEVGDCTYDIKSANLEQSKMLGVIRSHVRLVTNLSDNEISSGNTHNKNINLSIEIDDGFNLDEWGLDYVKLCLNNVVTKLRYGL